MNQYQFEQICRRMSRRYGNIYRGGESAHLRSLFVLEGNLLKTYRRHPDSDGRRLLEAIPLALYSIEGRLKGEYCDVSQFESEANLRLKNAILMAFDPFTSEELRNLLTTRTGLDLTDSEVLEAYYREPVICLLRIRESVLMWTKERGSKGYFQFLEDASGASFPDNDAMEYISPPDTETLTLNV